MYDKHFNYKITLVSIITQQKIICNRCHVTKFYKFQYMGQEQLKVSKMV